MTNEAFSDIVKKYERLIYTICYQFSHNAHTAEDLTQETFISAYQHIETCPLEALKPWLCKIATNKSKDYLKSAYNRRVNAIEETSMPENVKLLVQTTRQPEDITIENETLCHISKYIKALKEPYKKVSVMYFLEEKSVEDISIRLDRPKKTVHTQLYRAKGMLQKRIKEDIENGYFS